MARESSGSEASVKMTKVASDDVNMDSESPSQEDQNSHLETLHIKVRDFATLPVVDHDFAPTPNSGPSTSPNANASFQSRPHPPFSSQPVPEWFDPYDGIAMYDYHLKRREHESPPSLTRHDTEVTEPATEPDTPASSSIGLGLGSQAHPNKPSLIRRPLRRYPTPLEPNSELCPQYELEHLLRYHPKDSPMVRAYEIPLLGKLLSRLLAIGWVSQEEAESRWLPIDWDSLHQYEGRSSGPYPFTLRKIPQRSLPLTREQRIAWMNQEVQAYNATLPPSTTPDVCLFRHQKHAIDTHSKHPPLATRAGIWVYPDGDIYPPSTRARRFPILLNGQSRSLLPTRFKPFDDVETHPGANVPDGLGDDIPTAKDREEILKARVRWVTMGYWSRRRTYYLQEKGVNMGTTLGVVDDGEDNANANADVSEISDIMSEIEERCEEEEKEGRDEYRDRDVASPSPGSGSQMSGIEEWLLKSQQANEDIDLLFPVEEPREGGPCSQIDLRVTGKRPHGRDSDEQTKGDVEQDLDEETPPKKRRRLGIERFESLGTL